MRRPIPLLVLLLTACTAAVPPRDARRDAPDRAAEYRALKHQGSDDPFRSLARAREQMRRMERYSTTDNLQATGPTDPPLGKWRFLGPGNIGGRTRVLVIDPLDPRIMYTGGVSGGVWKTTFAGGEWKPIGDDLANIAINALVMHPTDNNTLYAGTGEGYFREVVRGTALPLRGDGIFVTHDAGETWTRLPSTANENFHFVNDLVVSTHDPERMYAATRTGVWRSADGGATWTRALATSVTGGCLDLAWRGDTGGDYLFASCGTFERATVWRAKNAQSDEPWEAVLSEPDMGRTSLAIAPSDPSKVYALAASNRPGRFDQGLLGVFRSTDDGDAGTWSARVTNAAPDYSAMMLTNLIAAYAPACVGGATEAIVTMGWYVNTIAVDPVDPEVVWVGGVDLFRSDDGGRTWGIASYWWASQGDHGAFVHADQHAIVFHPRYDGSSNKTMYVTNDGGIYRTDDTRAATARGEKAMCKVENSSMKFVALNNSYGVTQFYNGAVSPNGKTFIAGAQDNGTLMGTVEDGPNGWREILGGDGGYVAFDPMQPRTIYAEWQNANIHRSVNGGLSFKSIRSGLQGEFLFIPPFVLDPNDTRRLWLGGRRLWTTADRADTPWRQGSRALPALVSAIAVQPGNSDRVLAGTAGGHILRSERATTADGNTEWTTVRPREGFVSSITFDPSDPGVVYATYAGFGGEHLWTSTDAGATWSAVETNLPDMPLHSLAVDPTRNERLYLGTDLGVFVSLDRGRTWSVENTGFANAVTETVLVAQGANGPAVYAFTHGRGAWRAELVFNTEPRRRAVRH